MPIPDCEASPGWTSINTPPPRLTEGAQQSLNQGSGVRFCASPSGCFKCRTRMSQDTAAASCVCVTSLVKQQFCLLSVCTQTHKTDSILPQSQGASSLHCGVKRHSWARTKGKTVHHHTMERGSLCFKADRWPRAIQVAFRGLRSKTKSTAYSSTGKEFTLEQGSANISHQEQMVNILGFASHKVSVTATQFCHCKVRAAINNSQ